MGRQLNSNNALKQCRTKKMWD